MKEINFEHENYQGILESNFKRKVSKDTHYSLSAYAKDLGISVAQLSAILRFKKGLSPQAAEKISKKLDLDQERREIFVDMVKAKHARSQAQRNFAQQRVDAKKSLQSWDLNEDIFRSVSDWQHFAILQLTTLKDFRPDHRWIAERLGIDLGICLQSVERLFRLKLIISVNGQWTLPASFIAGPDGIPSEAIRKYHLQMLEKSKLALVEQPLEERDFGSVCFSLNKEQLPEIKTILTDFRKKLSSFYQKASDKNALYSLNLQLFRLDKAEESLCPPM